MHFICISETFKNALKLTDLIVLLKVVKELKSTMSSGRKFHIIQVRLRSFALVEWDDNAFFPFSRNSSRGPHVGDDLMQSFTGWLFGTFQKFCSYAICTWVRGTVNRFWWGTMERVGLRRCAMDLKKRDTVEHCIYRYLITGQTTAE